MESLSVGESYTEGLILCEGLVQARDGLNITDGHRNRILLPHWCPRTHGQHLAQ